MHVIESLTDTHEEIDKTVFMANAEQKEAKGVKFKGPSFYSSYKEGRRLAPSLAA